jgi:hypothetical protein
MGMNETGWGKIGKDGDERNRMGMGMGKGMDEAGNNKFNRIARMVKINRMGQDG